VKGVVLRCASVRCSSRSVSTSHARAPHLEFSVQVLTACASRISLTQRTPPQHSACAAGSAHLFNRRERVVSAAFRPHAASQREVCFAALALNSRANALPELCSGILAVRREAVMPDAAEFKVTCCCRSWATAQSGTLLR
jgi:hypothetical protein